jgi:hypothetical protein
MESLWMSSSPLDDMWEIIVHGSCRSGQRQWAAHHPRQPAVVGAIKGFAPGGVLTTCVGFVLVVVDDSKR